MADTYLGSTPLTEAAVKMHELFTSFMEAGFTESQAMTLLIGLSKPEQEKSE